MRRVLPRGFIVIVNKGATTLEGPKRRYDEGWNIQGCCPE